MVCIILSVVLAAITLAAWLVFLPAYKAKHFTAPAPANLSAAAAQESRAAYGDFYVSPDGNDKNIGTLEHPFRTVEAAQKAARKTNKQYLSHVVVSIMGGTYPTKGLKFTKADSGTDTCSVIYCAYGNGEVIFDGGADNALGQSAADGTSLVTIEGASFFSLSGVSIVNTSGSGLTVNGSNVNVEGCTVRQAAGRGIEGKGTKISVNNCQISYTGAGGIFITGGDAKALKSGENVVDNNLLSYTSQLNRNAPSISIGGVGATVSHNEIVNSPACAIYYMGHNNVIEYNYVHNTVLTDCGQAAIDSPFFRWDCWGNTVRCNCLNLIGSKTAGDFVGVRPCSGTEVAQNLLLNICGENAAGILLGGCRSVTVTNNVFVNTGEAVTGTDYPTEYAEEALELLSGSSWQSKAWQEAYPACAALSTDPGSDQYAARPANNTITNNICMQRGSGVGSFSAAFKKSAVTNENAVFAPGKKKVFNDLNGGDYTVGRDSDVYRSMKEFRNLPLEEIGRY